MAAAPAGHAAAEVALLYFPRLFLRRGVAVTRQLRVFAGLPCDALLAPPPCSPPVLSPASLEPELASLESPSDVSAGIGMTTG